ncbi:hypothetical protein C1631_007990 [Chryseobacterium phosphatilyticum]|uniref:Fibronectin type-III domain-containing protein n=1 Tax=Chryseobacterium phosphatilyticum TaxID=475075 RepID=A0A316X8Q6_9FLAO|nr:fibronectin type III domain-containing protein [Chryseobacterium phosphatilyticum]PWN69944.1 hypothetical protein C1631_007990 [Chryseobacterium phosphatilyticum]
MTKKYFFLIVLLWFVTIGLAFQSCTTPSLPYSQDFTANDGNFTFVNSQQTNKWFYGSAAGNPPNAIYVSDSNGNSNTYNIIAPSVTHAYVAISIPTGTTICNLSFDWKAAGEDLEDYLRVWLVPSSYTPTAGSQITTGSGRIRIGNDFNQQTGWQTYLNSNLNLSSFAGGTMRLVFEWRNNGSGGIQPPGAIDNIMLNSCLIPNPISVSPISATAATLNWAVPSAVPAGGYEYYLSGLSTPPNSASIPTGSSVSTTVNVSQLLPNTTYYWWVRSVCSSSGKSPWVQGPNFTTLSCGTVAPVVTVSGVTFNSATISWPVTNNAESYSIKYRPVGTTTWTIVNQPAAVPPLTTNTLNLLNSLLPDTLYEIEIAIVCNNITGGYSHNEFLTECSPVPPNVTIGNVTTNSALITWSPLALNPIYLMRWREVGTQQWNSVNLPLPPVNTFVLTGLISNKTYEIQIANTKCLPVTYSNSKVFTTERVCELPPPGLTITQLLPTKADVKWDPFPGATYILRYRKVGIPSWTEVATSVNNVVLTGLIEMTKYEMQVVNICNGIAGAYSPLYFFTTPTVVYCGMASGNSAGEHIAKVVVKPKEKSIMENASGASTYTDYTGVSKTFIGLIQGSIDNEIIVEKKWTGTTYDEGITVWIDFNRNGDFDINERIFNSSPNRISPVSGKFNVPQNAFVSMTDHEYVVMRVAMRRGGIPLNCTNFTNGEVEDYKVKISKNIIPNPVNQNDILFYPNPVHTILHVKNINPKADYKIYNVDGRVVTNGILLNNQLDVSKLINAVYVIEINDNGTIVQKKFVKE